MEDTRVDTVTGNVNLTPNSVELSANAKGRIQASAKIYYGPNSSPGEISSILVAIFTGLAKTIPGFVCTLDEEGLLVPADGLK